MISNMKMPEVLRIAQTVPSVTTLGPFLRFGIWMQGCMKRCPGCVSPEMQTIDGGFEIGIQALVEQILSEKGIEGITISGGEPFLQDEALSRLIDILRAKKDLGVIVYTGYTREEIADSPLLRCCDALIDGSYIQAMDDGGSLRGSSNQRLWYMTDRYKASLQIGLPVRETELARTDQGGISMVGVPSERDRRLAMEMRAYALTLINGGCI